MDESVLHKTAVRARAIDVGRIVQQAVVVVFLWMIVRTVFVVSYEYPEATVTGKFFYFWKMLPWGTLLALLVAGLICRVVFSAKDLLVVLFLGYYAFNYHYHGSIAENRLITIGLLGNLYFMLRVFNSFWPRLPDFTAVIILLSGVGEAILGLRQIYGYDYSHHSLYSVTGSFFNPGPYSGYIVFVFALALFYAYRKRKSFAHLRSILRQKKPIGGTMVFDLILWGISLLMLGLSLLLLPATLSRSAWVAAAGVIFFFYLFEAGGARNIRNFFHRKRSRQVLGGTLALILVCLLALGVYSLKRGSADSRLWNWWMTSRVIATHPVLGVGPGYYGGAYAEVQAGFFATHPDSGNRMRADSPVYAFNEYLQVGAESGLLGLGLFLGVLIAYFCHFRRSANAFQYGMIALLFFALTSYPFRILPILILLVFALAFPPKEIQLFRNGLVSKGIYILLMGGFVCLHIFMSGRGKLLSDAYKEWKPVKTLYQLELYEDAANDYAALFEELKQEREYLFEYGRSLNQSGQYDESTRILKTGTRISNDPMFWNVMGNNYKALRNWPEADRCYEKAQHILPCRIYPLYLWAKLSFEKGDTLEGIRRACRVVDFKTKIESAATRDMKTEMGEMLKLATGSQ